MIEFLSENCKITQAITTANGASGTSAIEGVAIDMAGYDGVLVIVPFGPITTGAATSIKMQQDTVAAMSGAEDIAGTSQTVADTADNTTFYIDLKRPEHQFVRLYVSRATQAATVGSATYIQYGARNRPVSHASGVSGEQHVNKAAGTA